MTIPETWLDIIPAIPLAWGVPVQHDGYKWVAMELRADKRTWLLTCSTGTTYATADQCSIDLDDPQGFGYSMRHWYAAAAATADDAVLRWFELTLWAWTQGILDDSDSLALARALAEVVS